MKRRIALQAMVMGVAASNAKISDAAEPSRKIRIFMLLGRGVGDSERGFIAYLKAAGYQPELIIRDTAGNAALLPAFVQEAKAMKPDLIYTWGTPQSLAVLGRHDRVDPKINITNIPVVFSYVAAPVEAGLATSLAASGRNFTGVIHIPEVQAQVNTMVAYQKCSRIGSIFNPLEQNSVISLSALKSELSKQSIELIQIPLDITKDGKPDAESIPHKLKQLAAQNVDFLYAGPDTFVAGINRAVVGALALELKLGIFSVTEAIVRENNGLIALASKGFSLGQFAGHKAVEILSGKQRIEEMPMEMLKKFSVVLNLDTARHLQRYPSLDVLRFAEVIHS